MNSRKFKSIFLLLALLMVVIGLSTISATVNMDNEDLNDLYVTAEDNVPNQDNLHSADTVKEEDLIMDSTSEDIDKKIIKNTLNKTLKESDESGTSTGANSKIDTYIDFLYPIDSMIYGDKEYVSFNVMEKDSDDSIEAMSNIRVTVDNNGKKTNLTSNEYGIFEYEYSPESTGSNYISVYFNGNDVYKSSNATMTFDVYKQDTIVSIDSINEVYVGKSVNIIGYLMDMNGLDVENAKVKINVNGQEIASVKVNDGKYNYKYSPSKMGINKITVIYEGNDKYTSSSDSIQFEYTKMKTSLVNTFISEDNMDKIIITYELRDKNANLISNAPVTIQANDEKISAKTNSFGKVVYEYIKNKSTNNITVTYAGTDYYNASRNVLKLSNNKVDSKINVIYASNDEYSQEITTTAYGEKITVNAILTDKNQNIIPNQKITIKINEKETTQKTDKNGIYSYTITPNTMGTNNVSVIYEGNSYYNPSKTTSTFKVTKLDNEIYATTQLGEKTLTITGGIICDREDLLNKENVTITINKEKFNVRTDSSTFKYNYNIKKAGTQNIKVRFNGNNYLNPSEDEIDVEISQIESEITSIVKSESNDMLITYKLQDAYDNAISNANLVITSDSNKNTLKTNKTGEVTYKLEKTSANMTVTAQFIGSDLYTKSSNKIKIEDNKIKTELDIDAIQQGNQTTVSGYLSDNQNNKIANQKLSIKINDKSYNTKTDKTGFYSYTYDTIKGSNEINVTYSGNSIYSPAYIDTILEVGSIKNTKISFTIKTQKYQNEVTLNGKILDANGKKIETFYSNVRLKLNNKILATDTINGAFSTVNAISMNSIGKNNITIYYEGEDEYSPSYFNTSFEVEKQDVKIDYTIGTTENNVGTKIVIAGKLTDANHNPLTSERVYININNNQYSVKTDEFGDFTYEKTEKETGTYKVTLQYNSNDYYNEKTVTKSIKIDKKDSKIYLNSIASQEPGIKLNVFGQLTDNKSQAISNAKINIKINDDKHELSTDENGYYLLQYTTKNIGTNNVSVSYSGNEYYKSSNTTAKFTVKKPVELSYYKITNPVAGTTVKISGKLLSDNKAVKNQTVTIAVNGNEYKTKTYSTGYFKINHTIDALGKNNITYTYDGNSRYAKAYNSTTLTVKKIKESDNPTTLMIYTINPVITGKTIKISGKLLAYGQGIKGQTVTMKINGKKHVLNTTSTGYFTVKYKATTLGKNNVTYSYAGSKVYLSSNNKTTFLVQKKTVLTCYTMKASEYGSTVKVSGKLLCNNKGLKGQKIIVSIGNQNYSATTYSSGYFTVNYKIKSYDKQQVTFTYAGTDTYRASTNKTTITTKKAVELYVYSIKETEYGQTVKVSGKLLNNNKGIKGQTITVTVNNQNYTAKTYTSGYFTISYKATSIGKNNVTFRYAGNSNYEKKTNKTTFTVKYPTSITSSKITNKLIGNTVKVSGQLFGNGKVLQDQTVTVTINNVKYTAKTDSSGKFAVKYKVSDYNKQNIVFEYAGNDEYFSTSNTTSFNVKKPTVIVPYQIADVTLGSTIKISGKISYNDAGVKNANVIVLVDGSEYFAKSYTSGYFTINYKITKVGMHNVTYTFNGNSLYLGSNSTMIFTGIS
ncbi:MAG: hypothetical protein BZ135_00210 [Methanosphaera sp. rholeuAM6]|nr:MAG: hypothetical protein BZ135_00210 [Methanosphaera sp. rholeuAM6]